MRALAGYSATFEPTTRGDDYAIYQYTSGTTRELPEAVKPHRSIVTLMLAALYGTGLRPGDRFSALRRRRGATVCGTARSRPSRWG
jgi:acetyl-CoA synthetase